MKQSAIRRRIIPALLSLMILISTSGISTVALGAADTVIVDVIPSASTVYAKGSVVDIGIKVQSDKTYKGLEIGIVCLNDRNATYDSEDFKENYTNLASEMMPESVEYAVKADSTIPLSQDKGIYHFGFASNSNTYTNVLDVAKLKLAFTAATAQKIVVTDVKIWLDNGKIEQAKLKTPVEIIVLPESAYIPPISDGGGSSVASVVVGNPINEGAVTGVTADVKGGVSGGRIEARVSPQIVDKAIEVVANAARNNKNKSAVGFNVVSEGQADAISVTLTAADISKLEGHVDFVRILTNRGSLELDSATLDTIVQAGGEVVISSSRVDKKNLPGETQDVVMDKPIYDFTITAGGKKISDLKGGKIRLYIPYIPASNESPSKLVAYYLNESNSLEMVKFSKYDGEKKAQVACVSHLSKYTVMHSLISFEDSKNQWFSQAVEFVTARELFGGVGENSFAPMDTMTRGMFATVLARLSGTDLSKYTGTSFTDVAADAWYGKAAAWAADIGIIKGYGDGRFGPNDSISREQMAVILHNYAKHMGYEIAQGDITKYNDASELSSWAKSSMEYAVGLGIITGKQGDVLDPKGSATRAEVATILERFIAYYV